MATASWMDPSTRKARLLDKAYLTEMPHRIHRMSEEEVNKARWDGCDFIRKVGESLKMYRPALCCACVLFNRFYARNGFKDSRPASWRREDWNGYLPADYRELNWRFVAVGCLFLAGKIEDNPKKITDVVRQFHLNQGPDGMDYELTEPIWRKLKDTILSYERLLLQDIEFDMIVEAPVAFNQVAHCIKFIDCECSVRTGSGTGKNLAELQITDLSEHARTMLRLAAEFVNDSLYTTLWLEYDAPTIALGLVWLTCKYYSFAGSVGWWKRVEKEFKEINTRRSATNQVVHTMDAPAPEILDDVGDQMIRFYEQRRAPIAIFPPLPDHKTGYYLYDRSEEPPRDQHEPPFKWRYVGLAAGPENDSSQISWMSREGYSFRCSCPVWKSMESMKIPETERTCRCIQCFIGGAQEIKRVGIEKAVVSSKVAKYLAKTRREVQLASKA
mmetsp:Transcript_34011/g.52992  ORF Transcript_34011/g.52992 Transcript_34011/m.52992 type:complete len:443 (+) Transcript_34011:44-1372(+)